MYVNIRMSKYVFAVNYLYTLKLLHKLKQVIANGTIKDKRLHVWVTALMLYTLLIIIIYSFLPLKTHQQSYKFIVQL